MRTPTSKHLGYADWLARLVANEDRGKLAALRHGLMLEDERLFELYGYLPPNFLVGLSVWDERIYLMVAALFGYHAVAFQAEEVQVRRRNLGESMRLLALAKNQSHGEADDDEPEEILSDSLKRRMDALLAAHSGDLFGYLRQVISLLKTEEIPVDWAQLLNDLQAWEWQGHPVQWQWSRSFYVGYQEKGGDQTDVS